MKRDGFVFYRSFWNAIKDAPADEFKSSITALMNYALDGEDTAEDFVATMYLTMAKPQIDANNNRYKNGKKGGKAKASKVSAYDDQVNANNEANGSQPITKTEAKSTKYLPKEKEKEKEKEKDKDILYADVEAVILNDGSEWRPTQEEFDEYVRLYPNVNVRQEFRNMRGWCVGNPKNTKTKAGVKRFVSGWLSREQNKPRQGKQQIRPEYMDKSVDETPATAEEIKGISELLKQMEGKR